MKKLLSLVLALAMLCGVSSALADDSITLEVWYSLSGASAESFLSIVDSFNAQNNGITVNATYSGNYNDTGTKITAALSNHSAPDVLIGGSATYSGAYGNYHAGDMALQDPAFNYDDVYAGLWEYGTYNGRCCNLPYGISTNTMFYNKDMAAAAGLDLENNAPVTWADFIEVCKTLKAFYADKADFIPFVVADEDWLSNTQLMQVGNPIIAHNDDYSLKTAAWGSEECAKIGQWWQDMVREGLMDMTMNPNGKNVFAGGNAAFFAGSSNMISTWTASMGDTLGAIEMPYFDIQAVAMGGNTLSMHPTGNEARDAASWAFVLYITSTEANAKFAVASGYLPIRASAAQTEDVQNACVAMPTYAVAFKQLSYAGAYTQIDDFAAKSNALAQFRQLVTSDLNYDPLTAMQESAEIYNDEANY